MVYLKIVVVKLLGEARSKAEGEQETRRFYVYKTGKFIFLCYIFN